MLNLFYQTLVSASIEFSIKRHLYLIFDSLLQIYQSTEPNLNNVADFYNNLFTSFNTMIQSQNLDVTKGALLVCQSAL